MITNTALNSHTLVTCSDGEPTDYVPSVRIKQIWGENTSVSINLGPEAAVLLANALMEYIDRVGGEFVWRGAGDN